MSNISWLSPEGNQALREQQQATLDLYEMGYSVRLQEPGTGFWVVVRPHVYQQRRTPFLELVCDMDDLPKVRDWVRQCLGR